MITHEGRMSRRGIVNDEMIRLSEKKPRVKDITACDTASRNKAFLFDGFIR
jgi:hypothetical protein